jgi:hypothetical protein
MWILGLKHLSGNRVNQNLRPTTGLPIIRERQGSIQSDGTVRYKFNCRGTTFC